MSRDPVGMHAITDFNETAAWRPGAGRRGLREQRGAVAAACRLVVPGRLEHTRRRRLARRRRAQLGLTSTPSPPTTSSSTISPSTMSSLKPATSSTPPLPVQTHKEACAPCMLAVGLGVFAVGALAAAKAGRDPLSSRKVNWALYGLAGCTSSRLSGCKAGSILTAAFAHRSRRRLRLADAL